jgi:Fe-S-cluster containining protein
MKEKSGPCIEKKCSDCCDPVKVHQTFPDAKIPVDEKGEKIWKGRDEVVIPESGIDHVKLKTFDCEKLDKETGLCKDYENRPDICRNSSCISPESSESIDAQHTRHISEKYITIKTKRNETRRTILWWHEQ